MKKFEISITTCTCTRFTIVPENRFTAEQILEMLNNGEATLRPGDDSIVQHAPPPYEGMTVLAKVIGHRVEGDAPKWEIEPEPGNDLQQPDDMSNCVQGAYEGSVRSSG